MADSALPSAGPLAVLAALWPLGWLLERRPQRVRTCTSSVSSASTSSSRSSLNLINGITGQFSLGHAGFMAVGAYASAACSRCAALRRPGPGAQLALRRVALLAGRPRGGARRAGRRPADAAPARRLPRHRHARLRRDHPRRHPQHRQPLGGARGLHRHPARSTNFFWVYACAIVCVVCRLAHRATRRRAARSSPIREDEIAAEAMGIDTTRYKVMAFVIGAFFAGVAGGLFAHFDRLHPPQLVHVHAESIEIVVMVVLGGIGQHHRRDPRRRRAHDPARSARASAPTYRMIIYSLLLIVHDARPPGGLLGGRELLGARAPSARQSRTRA